MLLLDRREAVPAPLSALSRLDERARTGIVLAVALLATIGLRLLYFPVPLGIDEGGVAFIAKAWGHGHGSLYGAYWIDRPPLLIALYKLAIAGGVVGVRVLGLVAALALVAVTTLLTRAVAGDRAARAAGVLAMGLATSASLAAVATPAELLAAVPAAASIGCLVAAHRRGGARWLAGAGLLAVTAALIKQSFLDAGFAGAVFVIASSIRDRRPRLAWAAAYAGGALIPVAAVGLWLLLAHESASQLVYALFGFRVHALQVLSSTSAPLYVRARGLVRPGAASGIFVVLLIAVAGLWGLRRERVLVATIAAWLAAGAFGVLAGGSYWPHYWIQLLAPATMLAAAALSRLRRPALVAAVAVLAAWPMVGTLVSVSAVRQVQANHGVLAVAKYVRTHARPGDTQYVMYAKANVAYYTGLQSPFPYHWSLIARAYPGATTRLLHLLRSPQRPTWIVRWQPANAWGLDPHGTLKAALHENYRWVARVHGRPIYHVRSSSP